MEIVVETEIDAPPGAVWEIVAHRFAQIAEWSSDVDSSRMAETHELAGMVPAASAPIAGRVTNSRVVTATEVLTAFSEERRAFTFEAVGLPKLVVPHMQSTTTVSDDQSGGTILRMHLQMRFSLLFRPLGFVMKRRMTALYERLGSDLIGVIGPAYDTRRDAEAAERSR